MSSTKIVLIVLIVIVVLFVIGIGFGVRNDRKPQPGEKEWSDEEKNCQKDWVKAFGSLFDPLRPKLKLSQKIFALSSSKSSFVALPPDKNAFRLASFRLKTGIGASIEYTPATPGEDKKKLELPRDTCKSDRKDDSRRGSLAIFKEGGSLLISCIGSTNCQIELE